MRDRRLVKFVIALEQIRLPRGATAELMTAYLLLLGSLLRRYAKFFRVLGLDVPTLPDTVCSATDYLTLYYRCQELVNRAALALKDRHRCRRVVSIPIAGRMA